MRADMTHYWPHERSSASRGGVVSEEEGAHRYPHVFRPIALGPVEVRNRIYMAPHGLPLEAPTPGYESHRVPAAEHAYYFAERAAGGVGLVFHSTQIGLIAGHPTLGAIPAFEEGVPSYRRVAEMVHEHGARMMAEIWYVPWQLKRWDALGPEAPALAPSALQHYAGPTVRHAMRRREIRRVVEAHVIATRNLRAAGYDGVELHVSHGSILEYFLSPRYNRRTDEYGGSFDNRIRLLVECLEVTRETAGDGMAVGMRLTADQLMDDGWDEEGAREILTRLAPTGLLDFVDLDISVEPEQIELMTTSYFVPKLHNADRVASLKPAAGGLAVIATPGRVTTVAEAERLLATGAMDMVGAVRGLIADPALVEKARTGRESEIRHCIAANHCVRSVVGWGCAVNAEAGREERWGRRARVPAPRATRVVVVGGGPAGLEAARVAALRGHDVTLLERAERLGGNLALWASLPGREHLATLPAWFGRALRDGGVDVRLGVEADAAAVLGLEPDAVVVATGAEYARDGDAGSTQQPVAGWDRAIVHTPEPVIRGDVRLAGKVLVMDEEGMHAAAGAAEIAAAGGAEVELVTRKPILFEAIARDASYVTARLRALGVTLRAGTSVTGIGADAVTLAESGGGLERTVPVDAVVLATMRTPVDALFDALDDDVRYLYLVGDALAPRTLREATYEGHRFARALGEEAQPERVTDELFRPLNTLRPAQFA
jgi:2,4-dienoyl-CoA reductase (NADPH2)